MKATHTTFLIFVTIAASAMLVAVMEHNVYGVGITVQETPPPLFSQVELRGLQKEVNGISSRYVITNLSSMTGTVLHSYYDDAGNPVGEIWTSQLPALESRIYNLRDIASIPSGYTGYAIISSDALITGTVLPQSPQYVYLPLVMKAPAVYILNNHSNYVDNIGYLHIVGEVQNNTSNHLRFVKIVAEIFNKDGQLLDTDFTYTYLDNLPAGNRTCFHISLEEPNGWSYYQFETPTYWTDGSPLPNLTVFNHSGSYNPTFGWYEIIGLVRNDHGARVEYVSPVATLYNASGFVVGCDFTYVNSTHLDPGQTSSFEIIFSGRDYADAALYRLQVDGDPR